MKYILILATCLLIGGHLVNADAVLDGDSPVMSAMHATFEDKLLPQAQAASTPLIETEAAGPSTLYSRILGSWQNFAIGMFLFIMSFPILMMNEFKAASIYRLLGAAKKAVKSAQDFKEVKSSNNGQLVHMSGVTTTSKPTEDGDLNLIMPETIKYKRHVEMRQWQETEKEHKNEDGSTRTTYSYHQEWSSFPIDSSNFNQPNGHSNPTRDWGFSGKSVQTAGKINFGAFELSPLQRSDMTWFQAKRITEEEFKAMPASMKGGNFPWFRDNDGSLYQRGKQGRQSQSSYNRPEVGDIRMTFETVDNQMITVLGQQLGVTFGAWAPTCGGLCGDKDTEFDEERHQLLVNNDIPLPGCSCASIMCCCCKCLMRTHGREFVLDTVQGRKTAHGILDASSSQNYLATQFIRLLGYLMMFFGLYMMFSPIITILYEIPFVGGFLGALVAWTIWIVCGVSTFVLACVFISIAWVFARPFLTLGLMTLGISLFILISHM